MISLNRSFCYGICFASITWLISLYLYIQISASNSIYYGLSNKEFMQNDHNKYKNSENVLRELYPHLQTPQIQDNNTRLNEMGLVKTLEDKRIRDEGFKTYAFNVLVSNNLGYHRDIPDTRNELCKSIAYPENLPTISVIICFYNEHYHTLLRSLHSIVGRTSKNILKEIILIDDFSDIENLQENLTSYIDTHFKNLVNMYRLEQREGLIRARIFGSKKATGDVLIFLDSHIEVNVAWAEPLLLRIRENRTNVVMPVIDIINSDTFIYTSSPLVRGGFNWGLHFKWENLPKGTLVEKKDFIKPIKSPTMAGGLFAIDRNYFRELGEYDPYMNIWGGENLEISFRIWMCGGHIELIPCSRIGHVFRQRRPYGSPDGQDTMLHNSLRVAHVWMDDYKKHFIDTQKGKLIDFGDISSRVLLRKDLKCHDFNWYIENVYPELTLPTDNGDKLKQKWAALENDKFQPWYSRKRNYVTQYQIKLQGTELCVQPLKDTKTRGSGLVLAPCSQQKNQIWYETDKHELVLSKLLCLESGKSQPVLAKCHETGGNQEWKHKGENGSPIYNIAAGMCLAASKSVANDAVIMKICTEPLTAWDLI